MRQRVELFLILLEARGHKVVKQHVICTTYGDGIYRTFSQQPGRYAIPNVRAFGRRAWALARMGRAHAKN